MDKEMATVLMKELKEFRETLLFKLYQEAMEDGRDASLQISTELPQGIEGLVLREQSHGGYRAFKHAATFFESLGTELKEQLKDE